MPVIETDNNPLRIENNILDNETVHSAILHLISQDSPVYAVAGVLFRPHPLMVNKAGNAERSQMWSWWGFRSNYCDYHNTFFHLP